MGRGGGTPPPSPFEGWGVRRAGTPTPTGAVDKVDPIRHPTSEKFQKFSRKTEKFQKNLKKIMKKPRHPTPEEVNRVKEALKKHYPNRFNPQPRKTFAEPERPDRETRRCSKTPQPTPECA